MKILDEIKVYPHEKLNMSKGMIRSQKLTLCSIEEIKTALKDRGVIEAKTVIVKKEGKQIETRTYINSLSKAE